MGFKGGKGNIRKNLILNYYSTSQTKIFFSVLQETTDMA